MISMSNRIIIEVLTYEYFKSICANGLGLTQRFGMVKGSFYPFDEGFQQLVCAFRLKLMKEEFVLMISGIANY